MVNKYVPVDESCPKENDGTVADPNPVRTVCVVSQVMMLPGTLRLVLKSNVPATAVRSPRNAVAATLLLLIRAPASKWVTDKEFAFIVPAVVEMFELLRTTPPMIFRLFALDV